MSFRRRVSEFTYKILRMGGVYMLKLVSRKEALGMIDSIFTSFHFGLMSVTDSGIDNSWERDYFWIDYFIQESKKYE